MKIVPLNRLLIQPTVQRQWIDQHQTLEFQIDSPLQRRFQQLWTCFQECSQPMAQFMVSDQSAWFNLSEEDHLFALLVGADHLNNRYPHFSIHYLQPNLLWSIAPDERT